MSQPDVSSVMIEQVYVRVLLLVGALGLLFLLRKPLRYPDKPGSTGFFVVILAMSFWLGSEGLTYFVANRTATLVLYNVLLFSITVCFVGWILMAYEFKTQRLPSRAVILLLGALALLHLVGLWTNFFWVHELIYRQSLTIENAIIVPSRGPAYWFHPLGVYVLIAVSTGLFIEEGVKSTGLRRRQAAVLAVSPLPGLAANVAWFTGLLELPFDLTPVGVGIGGLFLTWALYRTEFLAVAPIARRTVIDEMPEAVVILDEQSRVVDWNPAARGLFEVDDPALGMSAGDFFEVVPADILAELSVAQQTKTQVAFERDGRTRYLSVSISPIDVGRPEAMGRVAVFRDITAPKRREQRLLETNERLEEFASVVSHDIKGPLMEIRGSADVATQTADISHVEHVLDAADRLDRLVDGLLELARSGQQIQTLDPVELEEVSAAAWQRVWSVEADLVVTDSKRLLADVDRLQQLLENLFRNCVEHGPTGSRSATDDAIEHGGTDLQITVGSLPDGFYVEDDGSGIPAEERHRVFERGYTSSEDGTGLGLAIVQQITRAHGWNILATSGTAGGARFEITGIEPPP
jgi:PAS domain S-box-containing protein